MKLSAGNAHTEIQSVCVMDADAMHKIEDNTTAGNVAASVEATEGNQRNYNQHFSGKTLLKKRRKLVNDAESATESSEHFTENELYTSTEQQRRENLTPKAGKQRLKTSKYKNCNI